VDECKLDKLTCSTLLASKSERQQEKKYGNNKVQNFKPKGKDRIRKALEILNKQEYDIIEIDKYQYRVRSQSDEKKNYLIQRITDNRFECNCKDFRFRYDKLPNNECKHIMSVKMHVLTKPQKLLELKPNDYKKPIPPNITPTQLKCTQCVSTALRKYGVNVLKSGIRKQKYQCSLCGYTFVFHLNGFQYMRYDPTKVIQALNLIYDGLTYRKAARHIIRPDGKPVCHATLIFWVRKYTKILKYYTDQFCAILSDTWLADELFLNVKDCEGTEKGNYVVVWNALDWEKRFWIASHISQQREIDDARNLFRKAKAITDTRPKRIITDSYPAYPPAIKSEFPRKDLASEPSTIHIKYPSISHSVNNNRIERLHNRIREKYKTMRGAGNVSSAQMFVEFLQILYNFTREQDSLQNGTPAEKSGYEVNLGDNKLSSLLRISAKKYDEDHKFIIALRKKKLIRHVKFEDKDGCIFVIPKSRYTDETWLEIFNTLKKFGFEWKKIEDKWVWVKKPSSGENRSEGNRDRE